MNFDLTSEQVQLQDLARDVSARFDDGYWIAVDRESRFPREFWDKMAAQGLLGVAIPEKYGGSGLGMVEMVLVARSLSEQGGGLGAGGGLVAGPVFGGTLVDLHGTEEQKQRYLPGLVTGDVWAGAFTEPDSGSNISAITTRADEVDGHYEVHGQKMFISNISEARHIALLVRTEARDPARKTAGVALLIGDLPDPALQATPFEKLGSHWMNTNAVFLDGMKIPRDQKVGDPAGTWGVLYDVLNAERVVLAAAAIGTGLLALQRAVDYAGTRTVWEGRPIGTHQGLAFPLAQAKVALESAWLEVLHAAWLFDRRSPQCGVVTARSKYGAVQAALHAADQAIQTFGGSGYMRETGIERHWRDLRLLRLAPVSDEMTLAYIAQHDLGLPRSY